MFIEEILFNIGARVGGDPEELGVILRGEEGRTYSEGEIDEAEGAHEGEHQGEEAGGAGVGGGPIPHVEEGFVEQTHIYTLYN